MAVPKTQIAALELIPREIFQRGPLELRYPIPRCRSRVFNPDADEQLRPLEGHIIEFSVAVVQLKLELSGNRRAQLDGLPGHAVPIDRKAVLEDIMLCQMQRFVPGLHGNINDLAGLLHI